MAALPKAPENYNPYRNREEALIRRNWVIDRMIENGHATPEEGLAAKARDLSVNPRPLGTRIAAAEYFAEEVRREIGDRYGEDALNEGGLTIRTSLDPKMQQVARKALVDGLVGYDRRRGYRGPVSQIELGSDWGLDIAKIDDLDDVEPWRMAVVLSVSGEGAQIGLRPQSLRGNRVAEERETGTITPNGVSWTGKSLGNTLNVGDVVYVSPREEEGSYTLQQIPEVQGALTAMDTKTGRVLAMVGGFSFDQSVFNRATQAQRQPGSSFKPLIYAAALDNGYTPSSIILDAPVSFPDGRGGAWEPKNYGGGSAGPSTLRRGIEKSRNLMTVRLANDLGMPLVAEYSRRFGVYDDLSPVLAMSLGAGETTVLKMTAAYATIANGGQKITPTLIDRVQDRYGKTVYKHDNRECRECSLPDWHPQDEPTLIDNREFVLDPMTAYQITSIMEGVVQRGTAVSAMAGVGRPVAGKTGTTNDEKDAWFIGFTPDIAVGVYVGFDQPKPMGRGSTGGGLAAPIVNAFLTEALADVPAKEFTAPEGMNIIQVDLNSGRPSSGGGSIAEAFKPGMFPTSTYSLIGFQDFDRDDPGGPAGRDARDGRPLLGPTDRDDSEGEPTDASAPLRVYRPGDPAYVMANALEGHGAVLCAPKRRDSSTTSPNRWSSCAVISIGTRRASASTS